MLVGVEFYVLILSNGRRKAAEKNMKTEDIFTTAGCRRRSD
jgi:hypothetical protein